MANNNVLDLALPEEKDLLAPVLREGARQLLDQAIRAEVAELLSRYEQEKTPGGHQRVVRNGYQPKRDLLTGIGKITVRVPKVRKTRKLSGTMRRQSLKACRAVASRFWAISR